MTPSDMSLYEVFRRCRPLIVYICAGDPSPDETVDIADRIVRAGADVLELGLPHSDPIADGPVIQAASQRAIAAGMNTDLYFDVASKIDGVPKVFMGYYNMVYRRGLERFVSDCRASGICGMIVPDLPMEESRPLREVTSRHGVDLINMIAPNTPDKRIRDIVSTSSGFVYLVARSGVTGARADLQESTKHLVERVPPVIPRAVGFGVSRPEHAAELVRAGADGVIVGSACVDLIGKKELDQLEDLIRSMKKAISEVSVKSAASIHQS
ncbi:MULTISPECIES: tryptophan synthase subunit alpha [Methanothrix]|uniref:Tryptophan synthase alpha chain n=1 Tax=Methanothrix thermoacetophila (strain DSM 6194 / JCM 14653 / NBRC 101360 / PT) TaxID=349307 RepID=A0B5L7_METTP|nr:MULTISPECIES: tryptophan synthase subunit alpha [Methanothrix]ABK13991.1 tryptophan synthase, alpha chain [Methanothrix thermoacetophila PT]